MHRLDTFQMLSQWTSHGLGNDGNPVLAALSPPNRQFTAIQIEVLYP